MTTQFFIINLTDGTATKSSDRAVAQEYSDNDEYMVIDTWRDVVLFEGENIRIPDDSDDPGEPGEGSETD